jgi:hypothetical protein
MSQFDPNVFLQSTVSEVQERRNPLPESNEFDESGNGLYTGVVGEPTTRDGVVGEGKQRAGRPWIQVQIPIKVQVPPQYQQQLKLPPELTFSQGVFLDLTEDDRGLDLSPGKNQGMMRWRQMFDLNKPGDSFSWNMLQGRPVRVKLKHEVVSPQDGTASFIRENVSQVLKF